MKTQTSRGRRQFLLLALLFFAPLVGACLLYFVFPQWQPEGKVQRGELIDPARPIADFAFTGMDGQALDTAVLKGKWSYVYLGGQDCAAACQAKLYQLRQIRTLLNEKRVRVQRVYVAPSLPALQAARGVLSTAHPDLVYLIADDDAALRAFFGHDAADSLYLLDPLGNWLMRYAPDAGSDDIHKDIKRLLRISQIG